MTNSFNRIVLAYDDSAGSQKALELALGFIKQNPDAQLMVAHVYQEKVDNIPVDNRPIEPIRTNGYLLEGIQVPPMSVAHDPPSPATYAVINNSVDQTFFNVRQSLELYQAKADFEVLEGNPAESICEYAAFQEADLIILGKSGKGGLKRMFLGSVSEKVARNAPCHVLIAQ